MKINQIKSKIILDIFYNHTRNSRKHVNRQTLNNMFLNEQWITKKTRRKLKWRWKRDISKLQGHSESSIMRKISGNQCHQEIRQASDKWSSNVSPGSWKTRINKINRRKEISTFQEQAELLKYSKDQWNER